MGIFLVWFFRTLQSPIGPKGSDVTVVQRLQLRCADHFFLESSMSSDHFGQLPQLEELRIQYCKLRHLPPAAFAGLTNLKTLEIHSHNDDWSSVLMDVTKDTFQKLVNLRHLNLAFNNLWSLPSGKLSGSCLVTIFEYLYTYIVQCKKKLYFPHYPIVLSYKIFSISLLRNTMGSFPRTIKDCNIYNI